MLDNIAYQALDMFDVVANDIYILCKMFFCPLIISKISLKLCENHTLTDIKIFDDMMCCDVMFCCVLSGTISIIVNTM